MASSTPAQTEQSFCQTFSNVVYTLKTPTRKDCSHLVVALVALALIVIAASGALSSNCAVNCTIACASAVGLILSLALFSYGLRQPGFLHQLGADNRNLDDEEDGTELTKL